MRLVLWCYGWALRVTRFFQLLRKFRVAMLQFAALRCSGGLRPASTGADCCRPVVLSITHCLLLQKMEKGPDGTYPYKSPIDCAMKTFTQEGPLKFYTGFPTYCFRWVGVDHKSVQVCASCKGLLTTAARAWLADLHLVISGTSACLAPCITRPMAAPKQPAVLATGSSPSSTSWQPAVQWLSSSMLMRSPHCLQDCATCGLHPVVCSRVAQARKEGWTLSRHQWCTHADSSGHLTLFLRA